jgi:hypothetical protein
MIELKIIADTVQVILYLKNLLPEFYDQMQRNRCTQDINSCAEIPWIYGVVCVTIGVILIILSLTATLNWFFRNHCLSPQNKVVLASDLVDMTHSIQEDKSVLHKETNPNSPYLHHGPTASNSVIANPSAPPLDDDDGIYEELGEPKLRKHADSIVRCYMKEEVREPEFLRRVPEKCDMNIDGASAADIRMSSITWESQWDSGCDTLNVEAGALPTPPSEFLDLDRM